MDIVSHLPWTSNLNSQGFNIHLCNMQAITSSVREAIVWPNIEAEALVSGHLGSDLVLALLHTG